MFITSHAKARMRSRLDAVLTRSIESHLESVVGVPGRYVYIVRYLAVPVLADDGSNGDVVLAIVEDGSVETVCFRRGTAGISDSWPEFTVRDIVTG